MTIQAPLFDAIDANLLSTMICFSQGPLHKVVHHRGATLLLSSISSSFFNHVIDCRLPEENTANIIREIHAHFLSNKVSFSWWLGPNHTPKNLAELLRVEGLHHQADAHVMFIDLGGNHPKHFSHLTIQKVATWEQWKQFVALQALSRNAIDLFGEIYECFPISFDQQSESVEFYMGYLNDQAITCGAITLDAGIAQIHSLCTHPYFQHRGYAREMMQFLLQKAQQTDYRVAFLLSALEQCSLYEKLGFAPLTHYKEYAHSNF